MTSDIIKHDHHIIRKFGVDDIVRHKIRYITCMSSKFLYTLHFYSGRDISPKTLFFHCRVRVLPVNLN